MKRFITISVNMMVAIVLISCGAKESKPVMDMNLDTYKKPLVKVNQILVKNEEKDIANYIDRHAWKMEQTGTGLKYNIYKKGTGSKAELKKIAKINFEVRLITGDVCYSSKDEGTKELLIGKSGEINGLEEGILLLRVGDKARFIIPSHLAYGLLGDEKKIPKRATLIYDVELLEIK